MKKRGPKEIKIRLDEQGRPDKMITNSTAEFDAIIARCGKGEFIIASLSVGSSNGQWVFHIQWPQPKQAEMFDGQSE